MTSILFHWKHHQYASQSSPFSPGWNLKCNYMTFFILFTWAEISSLVSQTGLWKPLHVSNHKCLSGSHRAEISAQFPGWHFSPEWNLPCNHPLSTTKKSCKRLLLFTDNDCMKWIIKQLKQTCFPLFQEINWLPEAVITKSPCDNKHVISPDLSNPVKLKDNILNQYWRITV